MSQILSWEGSEGNRGGSPKRVRHETFIQANRVTKRRSLTYDESWGQGPEIERLAREYSQEVKDKGIVLRNTQTDELKVIPYRTRFSESYYPEKARKIRRDVNFDTALFLTLTIDPKIFYSLSEAYRSVRKAWHTLASTMAMDVKRKGGHCISWDGRYLLAVEFQKNGSPHLHIVLAGCRYLDADWVRENWSLGTFVRMEKVHDNRRAVCYYVTKYITKGADGGDLSFHHVALLWALNAKAFSCSRRIFNFLKTNCNKIPGLWVYMGSFPLSICQQPGFSYSMLVTYIEAGGG